MGIEQGESKRLSEKHPSRGLEATHRWWYAADLLLGLSGIVGTGFILPETLASPAVAWGARILGLVTWEYGWFKIGWSTKGSRMEDVQTFPTGSVFLQSYKGKPHDLGDCSLSRGENFLYVGFNDLRVKRQPWVVPPSDDDMQRVWKYGAELTVRKAREWAKGKNYTAVILDVPEKYRQLLQDKTQTQRRVSQRDVFQNLHSSPKHPEKFLMVLTPNEFQSLMIETRIPFEEAVVRLGDPSLTHLLSQSERTHTAEEKKRLVQEVLRRLRTLAWRQIALHPENGPSIVRLGLNGEGHVRVYPLTTVSAGAGELKLFQYSPETAQVKRQALTDFFHVNGKTVDDVMVQTHRERKGQLVAMLYKEFAQIPFDDLLRVPTLDQEEFERRLAWIGARGQLESPTDWRKMLLRFAANGSRWKTLAITAAVYFLLSRAVPPFLKGEISVPFLTQPSSLAAAELSPGFEELGSTQVVWTVQASDGFDGNGYWVQDTSRKFENGHWQVVNERTEKLDFPRSLVEKEQVSATLVTTVVPRPFTLTRVKIPIREQSTVSAVDVVDGGNRPVSFDVYRLVDGTVEVVIRPPMWEMIN